jgi:hypothetical protein
MFPALANDKLLDGGASRVCHRPTMRAMFVIYLTTIAVGLAGYIVIGLLQR